MRLRDILDLLNYSSLVLGHFWRPTGTESHLRESRLFGLESSSRETDETNQAQGINGPLARKYC